MMARGGPRAGSARKQGSAGRIGTVTVSEKRFRMSIRSKRADVAPRPRSEPDGRGARGGGQAHNRFEPSAPDSVRRVGNLEPFQALLPSKFEPRRRKSCSVVSSLPPRSSEWPPRSLRLHRLLRRIILTLERSRRCLSAKEQQELRRRGSEGKQELRRKGRKLSL